jgi:hypothetical protein
LAGALAFSDIRVPTHAMVVMVRLDGDRNRLYLDEQRISRIEAGAGRTWKVWILDRFYLGLSG